MNGGVPVVQLLFVSLFWVVDIVIPMRHHLDPTGMRLFA